MLPKLKILFTIPNFDTAGSGKVLYDLATGLNPDQFEVAIACHHNQGPFFKVIEALGFPIYLIDTTVALQPYYTLFSRLKPFRTLVKDQHFDIVHSWHWSSNWTEVLATRLAGCTFVYTKKAMSWGNIHWKIKSFLSHFVVTVNEDMSSYFAYKENQKLIPFGLDIRNYKPELFDKKPQTQLFKIITVAHLVPIKHLEILIHAIYLLPDLPIQLDVIGDDRTSYAIELKKLVANLQLEKKVFFAGKQADVRPFLAQADLYVITSKMEGMPMALVEAMAMGLPVLGSNVPGIRFVLKNFKQLLFDNSDEKLLSQKIELFYNKTNSERQAIGQQLRDYCISNFSMNRFINAHETLYLSLKTKKDS